MMLKSFSHGKSSVRGYFCQSCFHYENRRTQILARARRAGIPFDRKWLTVRKYSELMQSSSICPCCELPFASVGIRSKSLDRLIPLLGYVKGNVAVICMGCNNLKGAATPEEHRKMADFIERELQVQKAQNASFLSESPIFTKIT